MNLKCEDGGSPKKHKYKLLKNTSNAMLKTKKRSSVSMPFSAKQEKDAHSSNKRVKK
jgi:hypothetical protein